MIEPGSSVMPSDRTRYSGCKLKHRKFCLNIGKHIFTVIEHLNRLPKESPILEARKNQTGQIIEQTVLADPA